MRPDDIASFATEILMRIFQSTLAPVLALALLSTALVSPALAQDHMQNQPFPRMSMQGNGVVTSAPDIATITTGVVANAATANLALDANNTAMTALIGVVKDAGVAARDIQTSGFSVQPRYIHSDKRDAAGYQLPSKISGYQVSNSVSIRVRDLTAIGPLLDSVVNVGSNTVGSIRFGVDDSSDLLNKAREHAIENAISKATLYADAAGVCLGSILSISENGGYRPEPVMMRAMAVEMVSDASVPVEAGELSFAMSVNVEWALDNDC